MAENKTKPTGGSVDDYIASRANPQQAADCKDLMAMMHRVTGEDPVMWGPSIVGYGTYRYTYESGRTGEMPLVGFAIRGRELVVYLMAESDAQRALLSGLGPHKMGKSCLYVKRLSDVDEGVLEQLVVGSVDEVRRKHGVRGVARAHDGGAAPVRKVTPFLMFDDQLEAAIAFYTATFPDSRVETLARTGADGPVTSAQFVIGGQTFMGYNGGDYFRFSQAFSLYVDCEDQEEVDRYWNGLVEAGATPLQCGWITDPFGLTWQIVPRRFTQLIGDANPKKVRAVMDAMMTMVKLDVAALERAYDAA